jgi:hypothetical protein
MRHRLTLFAVLGSVVAPSAAAAQDPQPPATTPPATTPAPAPAQGVFSLTPERVGASKSVLAGRRWRVRGVIKPYVAGQTATIRFYRGSTKLKVKVVQLLPSKTGQSGYFVVGFRTKSPGRITVRASHLATPELAQAVAPEQRIDVLPLRAKPGARGRAVRLLQQSLAELHYVVGRRGVFDARTARAVLAFRKVTGLPRTPVADSKVFRKLAAGAGAFKVRFASHGKHVEADLRRQVLALINPRGHVYRIYPLSSGKPSTPTVLGHFRFYSKTPGTNAKGMVFSNYFVRGYAIHGYAEVPVFPASHGCLRVPIPEAVPIYKWVRLGDRIDVYR